MARLLAVDWDRREVRYVVASAARGKVEVRAMGSSPVIEVLDSAGEFQIDLERSLQAALAEQPVGRRVTLVGVDRGQIELLSLALPPAQDSELPDLVLNQAMRESPTIQEDASLDFLALDDDPTEARRVTAVAMLPEQLDRIRSVCRSAGLRPARLLFRPFAAASLVARSASGLPRVFLLLNLIGDEVDLSVLADGRPVFVRTVRLPHSASEEQVHERVLDEARRTMAVAAQSQASNEAIEAVCLLGGPDDHLPCREDAPLYLRRNFALPDGLIEAADKWYGKVRAQRARGDQRRGGAHAHQSEMS